MEICGFTAIGDVLRSGVYVLVHQGQVVYIGQSKAMLARIYTHRAMWGRKVRRQSLDWMTTKGILFDEVFVKPCPTDKLNDLEREMIALYKPKFNRNLKPPGHIDAEFSIRINQTQVTINAGPPKSTNFERRA